MDSISLTSTGPPKIRDELAWFAPDRDPIERAILITLAYGDVFDFPMTIPELQRYLIGLPADPECLIKTLHKNKFLTRVISKSDSYYTLIGREKIVPTRHRRDKISAQLWPLAVGYGKKLAKFPFVRMVAITGALAVNNVDEGADIDYLILTEPGRVWLSRAWCILLVRLAEQRGVTVCPNYFLSAESLSSLEVSLYSAHEVAQMVPVSGEIYYQELRKQNQWVSEFLPNAGGKPRKIGNQTTQQPTLQKALEFPQRNRIGAKLEDWEMKRKIEKFSIMPNSESLFSQDQCKGHFDLHGVKTQSALVERLNRISSQL